MIVDLDPARAARRRHAIFLGVSGAIAAVVIALAHAVLLPFVLALVIAYVLTPLVTWVEKKRVPRAAAIVIVYVLVLGTLGVFVRVTAPRVVSELGALRRELPGLATEIRTRWVPAVQQRLRDAGLGPSAAEVEDEDAPETTALVARQKADGEFVLELSGPLSIVPAKGGGYTVEPQREPREAASLDVDRVVVEFAAKSLKYAENNALEIVKVGRDIIRGVSRFFFVFGITLMLAAYLMLTREKVFGFFTSLVRPAARASFEDLLERVDRGLAGVVRGQLIICLVNGVLSAIGFAMVGLRYWPVLALVATVLSLIPIFGAIISSVPAVAIGLTQSVGTAAFVLAWIVGIHQLEANFLNPKIMGDAAKIHPVLVVFSLLLGEHYFHIVGALLAVPCMSIAQSVFIHVRRNLQAADPEMAHERVGSLPPPPPDPTTTTS